MSSRVLIPANPKLLRLAGLVLCVGVLIACSAMAWAQGYANPHLLVEPAWLAEHLDDPNIRIVDVPGDALYLGATFRVPLARRDPGDQRPQL